MIMDILFFISLTYAGLGLLIAFLEKPWQEYADYPLILRWGSFFFLVSVWPGVFFAIKPQVNEIYERTDRDGTDTTDPGFDFFFFQMVRVVAVYRTHFVCELIDDGPTYHVGARICIPKKYWLKKYFKKRT